MAIQSIRLSYPDIRPVTNIGFKPLKEGFFLERKKFVAHKTFNINNTNTGSFGIYVLAAQKGVTGLRLGRYRDWETDRKSTRLNSSHSAKSRMPSSA